MTEERRRVLDMLAEGKVTVEEAERLLEALQDTHREARKGRIPPIPSVGALQDTLEGLEEGLEGLEESLSGWSESENDARDKDGKTSMRDDTFAVGDNPRLVVRGFNGRIRVHAGEPGSIRVRAKLKKPHGLKYSAVQEGDLVKIEAKPDQQSEGFLHGFSRQHSGANIEVTVPVATNVDLATSNGPVELQGTEGGGAVQTKNGPIRVENFRGGPECDDPKRPNHGQDALRLGRTRHRKQSRVHRGRTRPLRCADDQWIDKVSGEHGAWKRQQTIHLERQHQGSPRRRAGPQANGCDGQRASPLRNTGLRRVGREAPQTPRNGRRRRGRTDRQDRERLHCASVAKRK